MATAHSSFEYDPETDVCYRTLDHAGFVGYRVGDDGHVWSRRHAGRRSGSNRPSFLTDEWRPLKSYPSHGHPSVKLSTPATPGRPRRKTHCFVHAIVLAAFVGPRPDGRECCHGDGCGRNNRLANLRWDTRRANMEDQRKHGVLAVGERSASAKLTEALVRALRDEYAAGGTTYRRLARKYGVGSMHVCRIVRRQRWSHVV